MREKKKRREAFEIYFSRPSRRSEKIAVEVQFALVGQKC